ncbi:MAG: 3-isopropylmalate dehydratase [Candidatus Rokubacteria bacterium]|nr:3-isopropylmalate dehydratase [Candidatus Rokubacteria bacterium]
MAPIRGRVAYVFARPNFDVDQIVGVANIKIQDVERLADLAMRGFDADFRATVRPGDMLVGGQNFGYGHPHYQAMRAMRRLGIAAVIAESFFPIYWRGEISLGFPQIACPGVLGMVERWHTVEVDWRAGLVRNLDTGRALPLRPYATAERRMLEAGGFTAALKRDLQLEPARTGAP